MRMMKKNKNSKSAFSIAYAIVGLVVVGIAIVGLTPVLTRKLPNLSTSSMIKNPKGWYESYNAAPKGTPYCAECEDADKHNRSWPDNPNYNSGTITGDKVGDPKYNKYVKDPSNLVPFERYCKSSNNCGYPKDKWNEGETHNEKHPHNCTKNADGKCHFKPAPGVTKFEIFAIGGGGGSGSAVAQIPKDKGETYKNLVVGKSTATPMGANSATDKTNFVQADFIDENFNNTSSVGNSFTRSSAKLEDKVEANITTNKKSATGIFYTAKDTAVSSSKTGKTYPTEAKNATLADFASKQLKRMFSEKGENIDRTAPTEHPMKNRYYFYTKDLGVYKYNQNSIYTLMPEWLKVYGDEYRYPCNSKDLTSCPNDMYKCDNDKCSGQIQAPDKEITKNYSQIAAVACSGDGGHGDNVVYHNTARDCSWMQKPKGCVAEPSYKNTIAPNKKVTTEGDSCGSICWSLFTPSSGCYYAQTGECTKTYSERTAKNASGVEYKEKYVSSSTYSCAAADKYTERKCIYKLTSTVYYRCTCKEKEKTLPDVCSNNNDQKLTCLPNVTYESVTPDNFNELQTMMGQIGYSRGPNSANFKGDIQYTTKDANGNTITATKEVPFTDDNLSILQEHYPDLKIGIRTGGNIDSCQRIGDYTQSASGSLGAAGKCVYVSYKVVKKEEALNATTNPATIAQNGTPIPQNTSSSTGDAKSYSANDGTAGGSAFARMMIGQLKCEKDVTGGGGGKTGMITDTCGGTKNGADPTPAQVSTKGDCSKFSANSFAKNDMKNETGATIGTYAGTRRYPGLYNYRYVWYMPFVTKHLMFGASGEMGEEVHTMVSLSEGQELIVIPGRGAKMTDYKSGSNGQNGSDSTVKNANNQDGKTKVDITAHGGKGGIGSQKTDEYLLCHIADKQGNKNLPCYKDPKNTNNIEALKQKENTFQNSVRMSDSLKKGNPGIGAMGFGTESVSDFVCEKRHADKWDKINNVDTLTKADVISAGGTLQEACKGNSKIRYILPNSEQYASGTGAVVILW